MWWWRCSDTTGKGNCGVGERANKRLERSNGTILNLGLCTEEALLLPLLLQLPSILPNETIRRYTLTCIVNVYAGFGWMGEGTDGKGRGVSEVILRGERRRSRELKLCY